MISLENEDEEIAFYNHDSDRAVGVVWPAIVENRLTDLIRTSLIPAEKEFAELFNPGRPIGDFGLKIKIAYLGGMIGKDVADDLKILAKIRNHFAHRIDAKDFETPPVNNWLDSMRVLQVHRELLSEIKDKKPSETTQIFVLSNELMNYRNSFHLVIRFLIHTIVGLDKNRKKHNESYLQSLAEEQKS